MVVSSGGDMYPQFRHGMNPGERELSSGESSGLQSPTQFGASFSPPHSDSFRYQHDQLEAQQTAAIVAPHYDYPTSLTPQQPPLLEIPLDMSGSGTHTVPYTDYYTVALPPRNHVSHDYPVQHLSNPRLPPSHSVPPLDSRFFNSHERRLPSEPAHDHPQARQARTSNAVPVDDDRKPPMSSTSGHREPSMDATTASGSRDSRKAISTVVIACRQCRGRKIRCDSTRPVCNNCVRRSNVCEYDSVPKRRGPDKNPGTRHRRCKRRPPDGSEPPTPKRRRTTAADRSSSTNDSVSAPSTSKAKENMASDRPSSSSSSRHNERSQTRSQERVHPSTSRIDSRIATEGLATSVHDHSPTTRRHLPPYASEHSPYIKSTFPRQLDVNVMTSPHTQHQKALLPASPTVKQSQRVWWTSFLKDYPLAQIEHELRYLCVFDDTGHWLSFLNLEYFIKALMDEEARLSIQPAFIYAGLAMATLMKSSEMEYKAPGRERALWLRDTAETFIQSSISREWIDASLAEAALIIALFETSAHPMYNPDRVEQALLTLDYIIRTTSLTTIDASDVDVLIYPVGSVPMSDLPYDSPDRKCTCIPPDAAQVPNQFSSWSYKLPWNPTWTDAEIRDEECRRLCWGSLSLMCNYVSQCVAFDREPPDFFLLDSANYAILFPGEVLDRVSPTFGSSTFSSTKESVWALYCRSMLLWSFTNRLRMRTIANDDKVELIYDAWSEAQSLQDSLRVHTCNLDTTVMYMSREYVYNTQITITQTVRSLQGLGSGPPIFKRKQAEEWLWYQDRVIQIVRSAIANLGGVQGYQLTRRPYQVTWFANQLSICLLLWNYDRSLKNALVLAKSILGPVEVMTSLWPCAALQTQTDDLRKRLVEACATEGIDLPMPINHATPSL